MEGDPTEVRYWHLLGLLLAATEQWKAAGEILERGAELGESGGKETTNRVENDGTYGHDREDGDPKRAIETSEADNQTLRIPSVSRGSVENADAEVLDERIANGNGSPIQNAIVDRKGTSPSLYLLEANASQIPPAASLLGPVPDHEHPSNQDLFEYALQLRMTQVALTEVVEGPEGAELKWVDVFSWHAQAEKRSTSSHRMFSSTIKF